MYPWQVFGLAGSSLVAGLPGALRLQCHLGLSYLLTAAGQFRNFTGFPFHSTTEAASTTSEIYLILGWRTRQALDIDTMWKRGHFER